ncbi:MAG: hypothetical protein M1812_002077 [Candelaria pacifica]|nr:MAG: hypothetical protein M1812_002077 [Candelaria pacifica]
MGQRHNRRRSRGPSLKPDTKFLKSHYDREAIEARDIVNCDEALPAYRSLLSLQARHWRQRYIQWHERERRHREKAEALEAEQRRVFGGEVGDESFFLEARNLGWIWTRKRSLRALPVIQDLVTLGLLYDEVGQEDDEIDTPVIEAPTPAFRSRSRSRSSRRVSFAEDIVAREGNDAEWDMVSSAASDSESEAWEILGDDS